jgi:hypothetical protein
MDEFAMRNTLLVIIAFLSVGLIAFAGTEQHLVVAFRSDVAVNVKTAVVTNIQSQAGVTITNMPTMYDSSSRAWSIAAIWLQHLRPTYTRATYDRLTNQVANARFKSAWVEDKSATSVLIGWGITNGVPKP